MSLTKRRRTLSRGISCLLVLLLLFSLSDLSVKASTLHSDTEAKATQAAISEQGTSVNQSEFVTELLTDTVNERSTEGPSSPSARETPATDPPLTEPPSDPDREETDLPPEGHSGSTDPPSESLTDPTDAAIETDTDPSMDDSDAPSDTSATEPREETKPSEEPTEPLPPPPLFMPQTVTTQAERVVAEALYSVNIRKEPTTSSEILGLLRGGIVVDVLDDNVPSVADEQYPRWVKVRYLPAGQAAIEGFVAYEFLRVWTITEDDDGQDELPPPLTPEAFEAHLTAEGFPESYKPALRALYQKYPQWEYRAFFPRAQGGGTLSWQTALAQQSRIGTSLVPIGSTNAMKSFDPKAYDFRKNTWYHLDRNWTAASDEAVAYHLDPRNFLDEKSIFMFESLAYDAEFHTLSSIRQALQGTFMGNETKYQATDESGQTVNVDHAEMFLRAAQYSGASPIFLAQRSVYELGVNGSGSVSGNYKSSKYPNLDFTGIRNYYNIGASSDPVDPIGNGLHFALTGTNRTFLLPWNTRYKAIVGGARWIADGYIRQRQHTLYLQKFDLDFDSTYGAFWHQYMTNINAPNGEASRVYNTYKNKGELNSPFVFHIPVLANMPASRAAAPSDNRNRNNYLSTLTLEGATLEPAFNPQVYEYTASFSDEQMSTLVSAKAYHSTAKVDRVGHYEIPPGDTKISVSVTSERGDLRVYQITLKRSPDAPAIPTDPAPTTTEPDAEFNLSSSSLDIKDNVLTGFDVQAANNQVQSLSSLLTYTSGYRLEVRNADDEVISEGYLGTGSKLHFYAPGSETPVRTLTVIIYGDANGDGRVNSIDMNLVFEHRMGRFEAKADFLKAMDVNRDERINSIDVNDIFEDRMGRKRIPQK